MQELILHAVVRGLSGVLLSFVGGIDDDEYDDDDDESTSMRILLPI